MYPAKKIGWYPHMLPNDIAVWERFLDKHGNEFKGFEYDVHVGGIVERDPGWSEVTFVMASELYAKRIDAVGYKSDSITIIEVKPEAGVGSVGQLVTYMDLYKRDFRSKLKILGLLVCENILPDEFWVLRNNNFEVFVV
jgi:hypothetical protein